MAGFVTALHTVSRHWNPASEKLEIIRIVEQSHLPARRTLEQLGIPRRTFCHWYDSYLEGGPEALTDRPSVPSRVWNRIPAAIHDRIIELALEQSELSLRELAVRFTDEQRYFVSEATVNRLLKAHDPAAAAGKPFHHTTTIVIYKLAFGAVPTTIRVGESIIWINRDLFPHSATSPGHFDLNLPPGARKKMVLRREGVFRVLYKYHPGMKTVLKVVDE